MAFTTPCYVRVDDPVERQKICRKLKKLGYKVSISISDKDSDNPSIVAIMGEAYGELYSDLSSFREYSAYHNCGEDTDLFLALATMQDDTDYMQWFTDGKGWYLNDIENPLYLFAMLDVGFRKAATEEIIEHFKNRKK